MIRDRQHFLLADEEIPPQHCVCHKGHPTNIMFLYVLLCALTTICQQKTWWDGKLGIWPVGVWEAANNDHGIVKCGALVRKNKSTMCDVSRELLKTKLIPSLMEK